MLRIDSSHRDEKQMNHSQNPSCELNLNKYDILHRMNSHKILFDIHIYLHKHDRFTYIFAPIERRKKKFDWMFKQSKYLSCEWSRPFLFF